MAASHSQAETNSLPARISSPRNKKDRLYNDILALFVQNDWKWTDRGSTHGKNFIQNMCDALWYLDRHHDKFRCVVIREHRCFDPIERLYYAADFEPICIYCAAATEDQQDLTHYPMCSECLSDKEPICKRNKN